MRPRAAGRQAVTSTFRILVGPVTAIEFAYSPCPNDTFSFHALTHGLVNAGEIATDPAPLISEFAPDMRARGWGRVVVITPNRSNVRPNVSSDGRGRGESEVSEVSGPYALWSGNGLLINTLLVPPDSGPACMDEVAQAALYFGSARNPGITGAQISVCDSESRPPGSPKR